MAAHEGQSRAREAGLRSKAPLPNEVPLTPGTSKASTNNMPVGGIKIKEGGGSHRGSQASTTSLAGAKRPTPGIVRKSQSGSSPVSPACQAEPNVPAGGVSEPRPKKKKPSGDVAGEHPEGVRAKGLRVAAPTKEVEQQPVGEVALHGASSSGNRGLCFRQSGFLLGESLEDDDERLDVLYKDLSSIPAFGDLTVAGNSEGSRQVAVVGNAMINRIAERKNVPGRHMIHRFSGEAGYHLMKVATTISKQRALGYDLEDRVKAMHSELNGYHDENARLKAELAKLKENSAGWMGEKDRLLTKLARKKDKVDDFRTRLDATRKGVGHLTLAQRRKVVKDYKRSTVGRAYASAIAQRSFLKGEVHALRCHAGIYNKLDPEDVEDATMTLYTGPFHYSLTGATKYVPYFEDDLASKANDPDFQQVPLAEVNLAEIVNDVRAEIEARIEKDGAEARQAELEFFEAHERPEREAHEKEKVARLARRAAKAEAAKHAATRVEIVGPEVVVGAEASKGKGKAIASDMRGKKSVTEAGAEAAGAGKDIGAAEAGGNKGGAAKGGTEKTRRVKTLAKRPPGGIIRKTRKVLAARNQSGVVESSEASNESGEEGDEAEGAERPATS